MGKSKRRKKRSSQFTSANFFIYFGKILCGLASDLFLALGCGIFTAVVLKYFEEMLRLSVRQIIVYSVIALIISRFLACFKK